MVASEDSLLHNGNEQYPPYAIPLPQPDEDGLNLRQLLSVARRRAFLLSGVSLAVSSGVLAKVLTQEPVYEGKFQLLVESVKGEENFDRLAPTLAKNAGRPEPTLDYDTQIQVLWSPQVMAPTLKEIQSQYPEVDEESIRRNLRINRFRETKILEVSYNDTAPEKIKFVLDEFANSYIKYSLSEQQTSLRQGLEFVNRQLPILQQRVDKLQENLQSFRQKHNLIEPEVQGRLLSGRISNLAQQRQETRSQLVETQSLLARLQKQLGVDLDRAIVYTALSEAPRYQQLLNQLQEVESQIAIESARLTKINPIVQRLQEQRNNLLPLLAQEAQAVLGSKFAEVAGNVGALASPNSIRLELTGKQIETINEMQVLVARNWAIAQAEDVLGQQMQQLAIISRQYTDLQRSLEVATESLNRFLEVRENLEIEAAQTALPWQLISEIAAPEDPTSPNVPRSLLLGAIAGLLGGAGAALLAEKLDNKFHSSDEIKDGTGLAILGMIPFRKKLKQKGQPDRQPSLESYGRYRVSVFEEAFRSLHADLQFLSPDRPLQSLVISSALPSEGKSTIALNLAQAAAIMGRRVLLVDADLRRPAIHMMTDLPNAWGLSNLISTDSLDLQEVTQRSPAEDNLYVLTAGQVPPDPTRLLSSQKMRNLIEQLQNLFDLVIFDTPPLAGLADAKLLAVHTGGIVMVVGLGQTDRSVLKQVLDGLKQSHTSVLGVVANGVKRYTSHSYGYYYQRYYASRSPELRIEN
ncbi:MAG: GumC family protein [Hormoscilla sp.]